MKNYYKVICGIILAIVIVLSAFLVYYMTKKFTVTFDTKGATPYEAVQVKPMDKVEKPVDPALEGYVFSGWYLDDTEYNFDEPVKEDITLEARWTSIADIS